MRVTTSMMFESAQLQTAAARDRAFDAQQKVVTGVRVVHPGDDPVAAGIMVSYKMSIDRLGTIDQTVGNANGELQVADGALQSVSDLLARAHELTVQLGNDTYSATERSNGATEIRGISAQIAQLMNTQVAGRYIFGGNVDRSPPFDSTGAYLGDTATRQIEAAPGLMENSSIRADQALKGVGGGVDVFGALSSIATALSNNDGTSVRASLANLTTGGDQVASALTQAGVMMDGFHGAQTVGGLAKDSATKVLASETEVDVFDAASQMAAAQQSLEATLTATAKSFQLSLLKFLP
jgi:flagellar hook-associated protein 3 FlgL